MTTIPDDLSAIVLSSFTSLSRIEDHPSLGPEITMASVIAANDRLAAERLAAARAGEAPAAPPAFRPFVPFELPLFPGVQRSGSDWWNDFIDLDPPSEPMKRAPKCGSRSRELRTALRELGEVEDILHDTIELGRISTLQSMASPDTVTELMRRANDIRDVIDPDLAFVRLGSRWTTAIVKRPGQRPYVETSMYPTQRVYRLPINPPISFKHTLIV